jgi:glycosyltransferase involved in cell wall biosynthesis
MQLNEWTTPAEVVDDGARAVTPLIVQIVQPIVPHYRVPFFEGVARLRNLRVRLCASEQIAGLPPSLPVRGVRLSTRHGYHEILGGRLLWQSDLTLDPDLRRGDVLVINGNPRFLSNLPLLAAARRRGVAVVWWNHGWSPTSATARVKIRLQLMRWLADVVLLYTDGEKADLLARGFDPSRVFALNNGLDDGSIAAATAEWPAPRLRQFLMERGLEDQRLLLFCGRLREQPSTDLDVALRALARLVEKSESYHLCVVGDGPAGARLRELATSLGIAAHVTWLGKIYDERQLAPWFLAASCFVYPGSIGLSMVQALAYGLPVITHGNRREHGPEIAALVDEETGLTFPRGDADALAARVERICTDPALRTRMGNAARCMIAENYSMSGMVQRFARTVMAASRLKSTH